MRLLTCLACACLALLLGLCSAGAQDATPGAPASKAGPTPLELIEDLRILAIVNALEPTPEQARQLEAVAISGKEGLAAIQAQVRAKLDQQRERLLAARQTVLRGGVTPQFTEQQLAIASQSAEALRAEKTEALILNLASRVRRILSPEQAARVENDLAPTTDQPWRGYARVLARAGAAPPPARAMPSDPGKWLGELRDLRIDSAEGDPKHEIEDFGKKMTRGLRGGTPLFDQSVAEARAFATQVLAMPQDVFNQREWELARLVSKQELNTRNQQRTLEGKPLEAFDPYRWLVEQVLLSPRATVALHDRAAAR
jgi:hypothetical protein